jgi:hypothetical protein
MSPPFALSPPLALPVVGCETCVLRLCVTSRYVAQLFREFLEYVDLFSRRLVFPLPLHCGPATLLFGEATANS